MIVLILFTLNIYAGGKKKHEKIRMAHVNLINQI